MVDQFTDKAEAALQKSANNRAYLEDMSQSMWERIHGYEPKKSFQNGELTTGQASEIYGVGRSTIAKYCELEYIPGAWRDKVRRWWHIPAESMDVINNAITEHGLSWTSKHWIRYYGKVLKNGSNGHQ